MLVLVTLSPWTPWAGSIQVCIHRGHGSAKGILFLSPAQAEGTELWGRMPHCPASQQVTSAPLLQEVTFSSSSSLTRLTSELYPQPFWTPPALGEHNFLQRCMEINKTWVMAGNICARTTRAASGSLSAAFGDAGWLPTPICYKPVVKRQDVKPTNCSSAERK